MNKSILQAAGFGNQVKAVEVGNCPLCGHHVDVSEFKDSVSRREFEISGLCNFCQDDVFATDPDQFNGMPGDPSEYGDSN
jgi:hypothetical protein